MEEAKAESLSAAADYEAPLCTVRTSDFNFLIVLGKGSFGKVTCSHKILTDVLVNKLHF